MLCKGLLVFGEEKEIDAFRSRVEEGLGGDIFAEYSPTKTVDGEAGVVVKLYGDYARDFREIIQENGKNIIYAACYVFEDYIAELKRWDTRNKDGSEIVIPAERFFSQELLNMEDGEGRDQSLNEEADNIIGEILSGLLSPNV